MKLPEILTQNRPKYMKLPKILPKISTPYTNRGVGAPPPPPPPPQPPTPIGMGLKPSETEVAVIFAFCV